MPNSSGSCERSSKPRQAVVLIHGIGEQRPMETLKGFVAALLCDHPYYSKPDVVSDSYELRRFKLRRDALEGWPETDFYEYYWAHQMYGTTWSHVLHWFLRVMKRGGRFLGAKPTPYPRLRFFARISWGRGGCRGSRCHLVGVDVRMELVDDDLGGWRNGGSSWRALSALKIIFPRGAA